LSHPDASIADDTRVWRSILIAIHEYAHWHCPQLSARRTDWALAKPSPGQRTQRL